MSEYYCEKCEEKRKVESHRLSCGHKWKIVNTSKDEELKPCPFCGGKPCESFGYGVFYINCENENCTMMVMTDPVECYSEEEYNSVVKVWNTRLMKI